MSNHNILLGGFALIMVFIAISSILTLIFKGSTKYPRKKEVEKDDERPPEKPDTTYLHADSRVDDDLDINSFNSVEEWEAALLRKYPAEKK